MKESQSTQLKIILQCLIDLSETIQEYNKNKNTSDFLKEINKLEKKLSKLTTDKRHTYFKKIYGEKDNKNNELKQFDKEGYNFYSLFKNIPSINNKKIIYHQDMKHFFYQFLNLIYIGLVWCGYNNTKNMKEFTKIMNYITDNEYFICDCYQENYYCGRGIYFLQNPKNKKNQFLLLNNLNDTDEPDPYIILKYENIQGNHLEYINPNEILIKQLLLNEFLIFRNKKYKINELFTKENQKMNQMIKQMKQKNSKGQRTKTKQEIINFYEDELENARETRDFHRMSMEWFRKKERVIHKKLTKELEEFMNQETLLNENIIQYQVLLKHNGKKYSKSYIYDLDDKKKIDLFEYFRWICNLYQSRNSKKYSKEAYQLFTNPIKKLNDKNYDSISSST